MAQEIRILTEPVRVVRGRAEMGLAAREWPVGPAVSEEGLAVVVRVAVSAVPAGDLADLAADSAVADLEDAAVLEVRAAPEAQAGEKERGRGEDSSAEEDRAWWTAASSATGAIAGNNRFTEW